jgi:hypothetical protein
MPEVGMDDLFAYVAAFVTITLALALCDLVQSLHRLIRVRSKVRWHATPLLAAAFVFFTVLSEFFSLWQFHELTQLGYYELVALVGVASLFAMSACAALPDDVPEPGLDLMAFYLDNRRYLYVVLALGFAGDFLRGMLLGWKPGSTITDMVGTFAASWTGIILAVLVALAWTGRPRWHLAGVLALLVLAHMGYVGWVIASPG